MLLIYLCFTEGYPDYMQLIPTTSSGEEVQNDAHSSNGQAALGNTCCRTKCSIQNGKIYIILHACRFHIYI